MSELSNSEFFSILDSIKQKLAHEKQLERSKQIRIIKRTKHLKQGDFLIPVFELQKLTCVDGESASACESVKTETVQHKHSDVVKDQQNDSCSVSTNNDKEVSMY